MNMNLYKLSGNVYIIFWLKIDKGLQEWGGGLDPHFN